MRLCVFCGSSAGCGQTFVERVRRFGHVLVSKGIGLVYGGGAVGLMGALADAVLARGGEAIGVIPRVLVDREIARSGLSDLRIVETMHERKAAMADLADGFVALPGGAGTLEEIFEAWTWAQLGLHRKPCGILNVGRYYDQLVAFLDGATVRGFLHEEHRRMFIVERSAERLLERFVAYRAPTRSKWEA